MQKEGPFLDVIHFHNPAAFRGQCWFIPHVEDLWRVLATTVWRREELSRRRGGTEV